MNTTGTWANQSPAPFAAVDAQVTREIKALRAELAASQAQVARLERVAEAARELAGTPPSWGSDTPELVALVALRHALAALDRDTTGAQDG